MDATVASSALIVRASWRPAWLSTLLAVGAGIVALSVAGWPPDPALLAILTAAVGVAELLTLDLPDRRGVSLAALPVVMAAAVGGAPTVVWAAGLGTLAASLAHRRPPLHSLGLFGRAAIAAWFAATAATSVTPASLGAADPLTAAPGALLCAALYALVSELLTLLHRRATGEVVQSHVDVVVSIGLVPIALGAWALQERAGSLGLLAAGGGLVAVLAVARSAINLSTHHADLRRLYELARDVAASPSPEATVDVLAADLPRWTPFEQLALVLPVDDVPRLVASRGPALLPADWQPGQELDRLVENGPATARAGTLPLPRGTHGLIAPYGRRGALVLVRRRPFRAEDVTVLGLLLGQLSAVLEQVRLLDEVDRQRERLAVLLASSVEGIFVIDTDGRIGRVNGALAAMVGRSEKELVGRSVVDVLRFEDTSEASLPGLLVGVEPGTPLMTEGILYDSDGRARDVLLSYAAVVETETLRGGIGIVRDVTAMRQAQRERDDFVSVMTHDLRQPLAGILGYAQLLERGLSRDGDERMARYAGSVRSGGERMLRMINNLLELSRIESGRVDIEVARVPVESLVDDVIRALEHDAGEKELTVRLETEGKLPQIVTSEPLLRETIANLVGNAVKYTKPGGSVTVRLRADVGGILIAVTDTGIGIPADALPRLFTRFFRTGQLEVRQLRGSGLGLALTKMMVERIGGTIAVESELGVGSTFTVRLPLAMEPVTS
jgi:PAS domain S-box-containing protein